MEQYFLSVSIYTPSSNIPQAPVRTLQTSSSQFGRGPRACLGNSVSLMEMNRIIPELEYDWFIKQEDFQVSLSKSANGRTSMR